MGLNTLIIDVREVCGAHEESHILIYQTIYKLYHIYPLTLLILIYYK